jgi:hypothetical protein
MLLGMIFVQSDEVAKCDGELHFLGHIELVEPKRLPQTHNDERKTKRVQT